MPQKTEDHRNNFQRSARLEQFEQRLVLSADPLSQITNDYLVEDELGPQVEQQLESFDQELHQTLAEAHQQTGLDQVRADYGLTGAGQTVAVIDSGIAWDHYALGDGFGADYRVVGGWDFAENDANPYDDPILGSHGTHVSGIIAADAGVNSGVAPGADIVALRVFNDNGVGYLEWVEDALQWVLENREAHENPITTVNLSLGTNWNSDSVPSWATLEDEFSALEDAGVFISVAAGNSFTNYNEKGLSYPAVSEYVVPVASLDDDGQLSYFSQRDDRVIAAPGRTITSTVPDYVGNQNNRADDWASYSGTSMAAPYVAGSSMILREAMQLAGWTDITQDDIYDVMVDTADQVWDAVTGSYYNALNLEAAVSSVLPADDYGSTAATAHDLGMLQETLSVDGEIGTFNDTDYFSFTASASGTVTIDATTAGLSAPTWSSGGETTTGESLSIDVVAGQSYTFGIGAAGKLGSYTLDFTLASDDGLPESVDWGRVDFAEMERIGVDGESWYRLTADNSGLLTVEAIYAAGNGNVDITLYDENFQQIATGAATGAGQRADTVATAGSVFYVQATGQNDAVDFRLTNLVSVAGRTVSIADTEHADTFDFAAGAELSFAINGVTYQFDSSDVDHVLFYGGAGDAARLSGTSGYDVAQLRAQRTELVGAGYQASVLGVDQVHVDGRGGGDRAYLYDTAGNETVAIDADSARMTGDTLDHLAQNFSNVYAYSTGGTDTVDLTGTSGDDTLLVQNGTTALTGTGFAQRAYNFGSVFVDGNGGNDTATLHGTATADTLWMTPSEAKLTGGGIAVVAANFAEVTAHAGGGADRVYFEDSLGNDVFRADPTQASLTGSGYANTAVGFTRYYAFASAGDDTAYLTGTSGNETLTSKNNYTKLSGSGFYAYASAFDSLYVDGGGGTDSANLHAGDGNNRLWMKPNETSLTGGATSIVATGFAVVDAFAGSRSDRAYFEDSLGDDLFRASPEQASLTGTDFSNTAHGFGRYYAFASAGNDVAHLTGTGNETLTRRDAYTKLSGDDFYGYASSFDKVHVAGRQDDTPMQRRIFAPVDGGAAKNVARTPRPEPSAAGGSPAGTWNAEILLQMRGFADVASAILNRNGLANADSEIRTQAAWQAAIESTNYLTAAYDLGDVLEHATAAGDETDAATASHDRAFANWPH